MNYGNRVSFAIGTGRCGTLFMHQLMSLESNVASSHERNPNNEAFHRYCKWNELPVDDEGFLTTKESEVHADLASHGFSFEASPYLSLSVKELHERFGARFLLLVRRPDRVVTSFAHKGFYRGPYAVRHMDLAAGYQDQCGEKMFMFLARVAPRGEFLKRWNEMTQVGRVAWYWNAWNARILALLEELPKESYRILRIEDLDYVKYLEVASFLGYQATVSESDFERLRTSKPHAFWKKRNLDEWSDTEILEFETQVAELAGRFGYEHQVRQLVAQARAEKTDAQMLGHIAVNKPVPKFWSMRRTVAGWLRGIAKHVDAN